MRTYYTESDLRVSVDDESNEWRIHVDPQLCRVERMERSTEVDPFITLVVPGAAMMEVAVKIMREKMAEHLDRMMPDELFRWFAMTSPED